MSASKVLGALGLALAAYWLRFYLLRHEALTLIQLVALLCAAALLLMQRRPQRPVAVWFRSWLPVNWLGWTAYALALVTLGVVFRVMDADSHSASDTLHRIVPTYMLVAAVLVKVVYERSAPEERRPAAV
jgi:hypothetical protein